MYKFLRDRLHPESERELKAAKLTVCKKIIIRINEKFPERFALTITIQELSYRKRIARQLRTQFVEGISVTLKSTLRVTQGHWKLNHWTVWLSGNALASINVVALR